MTVSFALAQAAVYAEAPTVRDWPDIFIGDIESVSGAATQGNVFVFPDAFDVRDFFVSDDTEDSETVKWTFLQLSGNEILINGVPSLDGVGGALGSTSDPIQPNAARNITGNNNDTAIDAEGIGGGPVEDGNEFTLTFRDADLSPLPNGPHVEPGTFGVVNVSDLTIFASDMTTASQHDIMVSTINQGTDTLTGLGLTLTLLPGFPQSFTASALGWTSVVNIIPTNLAIAAQGANGLCVTVDGSTGAEGGLWASPELIELASETIYRIRMDVFTDQATANAIPLVVFGLFDGAGVSGGDAFLLDVLGGANGIDRPQGLDIVDMYYAPAAARIDGWTMGAFQPLEDGFNDLVMTFGIFNSNANINFAADSGSMCLTTIAVSSGNINDLNGTGVTAHDANPPTAADYLAISIVDSTVAGDNALTKSATFGAQGVTFVVAPTSGGTNTSVAAPGQRAVGLGFMTFADSGDGVVDNTDTHPIPWNDHVLLEQQVTIASTSGGADPVNAVRLSSLAATSETGASTFVTGGAPGGVFDQAGSPVVGEDRIWSHFLFTSNPTLDTTPGGIQFAISLVNRSDLYGGPGTGADPAIVKRHQVFEHEVPQN
jgi:hypothetical protein